MPRWEPHARERLVSAALDLYASRGYDDTTIGDIAAHAGVTPRTYFRYFPDKREVLFDTADDLRDRITRALALAPAHLAPWAAVLHALGAAEELFERGDHDALRRRAAVVDAADELREREARKLADLAAAVAAGLADRGSDPADARLVADLAVAVFVDAARRWTDGPSPRFGAALHRAAERAGAVLDGSAEGVTA